MAILVVAVGLLALIAYGDVRTRRIPNSLCVGIAVLGAFRLALANDPFAAGQTIATAAVIFAAAFLLFWRGMVGGGDVKLVAATALLVGYREVFGFLALMSLCGGVLALTILARDICRPRLIRLGWPVFSRPLRAIAGAVADPEKSTIPYGVAIAAASVITLMLAR